MRPATPPPSNPSDLPARARIRDAALLRFGRDGYVATSVRSIAADVGVSPGLLTHHYGSKAGLRDACDAYVLEIVSERRKASGAPTDWLAELQRSEAYRPVVTYLTAALTTDSALARSLFDGIVAATEAFLVEGTANGTVRAGVATHEMALTLTAMNLGVYLMQDNLARNLGIQDGFAAMIEPAMIVAMTELYTHGVFAGDSFLKLLGPEQASAEPE